MSLHAFMITRSKVLWACKMPNCMNIGAWDAKVSRTYGKKFLRHRYFLHSYCLEELYRLLVANLQPLLKPSPISCFVL